MALRGRILRVTLGMPNGHVTLNESLNLRIRIHKDALAMQSRASIEVSGLTTQMRESLLSQFTAWNKRKVEMGQISINAISLVIEAGWRDQAGDQASMVFVGQVVLVDLVTGPPNITVRITCFSSQIDKSQFTTSRAPAKTTYYGYVEWAAREMGLGANFICDTSFNDQEISNPARSIYTRAGLLIDLQNIYRPAVAAFIDDGRLIVKDMNKIINKNEISLIADFVGTPSWTEWGVEFTVLFDSTIRLAHAAQLTSIMNPSLNGLYVVMSIDYDLTSREKAFYVKVAGSPPANG